MSDFSRGEGWWQASDGKWYPPETAGPGYAAPTQEVPTAAVPPIDPTQPFAPPGGPPTMAAPMGPPSGPPMGPPLGAPTGPLPGPYSTPPAPPARSGLGTGPIIGIVVAVVVIIGAIVFFATSGDGNKKNVAATQSSSSSSSSSKSSSRSSSSKESSSSSVATPSGFKVITNKTEGVSISVPNDFTEFDASKLTDSDAQSSLSELNPDIAPFLSSGQALIGNSVLTAAGRHTQQIVIVTKIPGGVDPTISEFSDAIASQLDATGLATDVTTDTVSLRAGDALKVTLTLNLTAAGGSAVHVQEVIFFVKVGSTTWGILGVSLDDPGRVFDQIADTFAVSS